MAKDFAEKYLGEEDDISRNLFRIYCKAKEQIAIKIKKAKE